MGIRGSLVQPELGHTHLDIIPHSGGGDGGRTKHLDQEPGVAYQVPFR